MTPYIYEVIPASPHIYGEGVVPPVSTMKARELTWPEFRGYMLSRAFGDIFNPHMGDWPYISTLGNSEDVVAFMKRRTELLNKMLEVEP